MRVARQCVPPCAWLISIVFSPIHVGADGKISSLLRWSVLHYIQYFFFSFSSLGRHEDSVHFPAIANNTVSKRTPYTTGVPHPHSVTSNSLGGQVSPVETLICVVQLNIYVTFVFSFLEHRSLSAKGIFLNTAYLLLLIWNSAWKKRIACITLLKQAK